MEKNELLSLTFEEALKRLEDVVDTLESGEVPLEKAIDLFSRWNASLPSLQSEIRQRRTKDRDPFRRKRWSCC